MVVANVLFTQASGTVVLQLVRFIIFASMMSLQARGTPAV